MSNSANTTAATYNTSSVPLPTADWLSKWNQSGPYVNYTTSKPYTWTVADNSQTN